MCTTNENINRLQRISRKSQSVLTALMFGVPITILMYWIFFNHLPASLTDELLPAPADKPLHALTLFAGFLISSIPAIPAMFGIYSLKKLFNLYEREVVFSSQNAEYILKFGYNLIAWVAAKFVFVALISIALTINNVTGERMLVIQVDVSDIAMLISGLVVILISWTMREAAIMADEQKYTV